MTHDKRLWYKLAQNLQRADTVIGEIGLESIKEVDDKFSIFNWTNFIVQVREHSDDIGQRVIFDKEEYTKGKILEVLGTKYMNLSQIMKSNLGVSINTLRKYLDMLVKEGVILKDNRKIYSKAGKPKEVTPPIVKKDIIPEKEPVLSEDEEFEEISFEEYKQKHRGHGSFNRLKYCYVREMDCPECGDF